MTGSGGPGIESVYATVNPPGFFSSRVDIFIHFFGKIVGVKRRKSYNFNMLNLLAVTIIRMTPAVLKAIMASAEKQFDANHGRNRVGLRKDDHANWLLRIADGRAWVQI